MNDKIIRTVLSGDNVRTVIEAASALADWATADDKTFGMPFAVNGENYEIITENIYGRVWTLMFSRVEGTSRRYSRLSGDGFVPSTGRLLDILRFVSEQVRAFLYARGASVLKFTAARDDNKPERRKDARAGVYRAVVRRMRESGWEVDERPVQGGQATSFTIRRSLGDKSALNGLSAGRRVLELLRDGQGDAWVADEQAVPPLADNSELYPVVTIGVKVGDWGGEIQCWKFCHNGRFKEGDGSESGEPHVARDHRRGGQAAVTSDGHLTLRGGANVGTPLKLFVEGMDQDEVEELADLCEQGVRIVYDHWKPKQPDDDELREALQKPRYEIDVRYRGTISDETDGVSVQVTCWGAFHAGQPKLAVDGDDELYDRNTTAADGVLAVMRSRLEDAESACGDQDVSDLVAELEKGSETRTFAYEDNGVSVEVSVSVEGDEDDRRYSVADDEYDSAEEAAEAARSLAAVRLKNAYGAVRNASFDFVDQLDISDRS